MKARLIASAVLAASVILSTTGCNMISAQATLKQYDASDGVSANVGSLAIRNAVIITPEGADNEEGVLAMTVVNAPREAQSLRVEYPGGAVTVDIAAQETVVFGLGAEAGVTLPNLTTPAGADAALFFQYGTETGDEVRVPVLTTALPEYSTITPAPAEPTSVPEPSSTPAE